MIKLLVSFQIYKLNIKLLITSCEFPEFILSTPLFKAWLYHKYCMYNAKLPARGAMKHLYVNYLLLCV